MPSVLVHESALKHGLSENGVLHAWRNAFVTATRYNEDGTQDSLAVGVSQDGKVIEMVADESLDFTIVFHANSPVSNRMMVELNLAGR